MKKFSLIICYLLYTLSIKIFAQTYSWPLFPAEYKISSTFGEYRGGSNPHFHEGNDIPTSVEKAVFPITLAFQLYYKEYDPIIGWIVKIIHYDDYGQSALSEGSSYIHMWNIDNLEYYTVYIGDPISTSTSFYDNHLHLEYREPFDLTDSKNPFYIPELRVDEDNDPILFAVYVDYSLYGDADVDNWNFLCGDFFQYYSTVTGGGYTFVQLTLPDETPHNDWDDPHIIISGNRKVRFTVKSWDETTEYNVCGPYTVAMYVDKNITFFDLPTSPIYKVQFDKLDNSGSADKHEEEDVYHTEEPLVSGMGEEKYYRLYPHDADNNGLPAVVKKAGLLATENLEEGQHMIRIIATDWNENRKTGDFHIYIRKSEWVDFCRGFCD